MANAKIEVELELNKMLIDKLVELAAENEKLRTANAYQMKFCPVCGSRYGQPLQRPPGCGVCRYCGSDLPSATSTAQVDDDTAKWTRTAWKSESQASA
jgi:transcription initiation factor IIE alpha subunit